MEGRRLSHSDDGALPYHAKRRKTDFHQNEQEAIHDRYTVAWICVLHIEMAAARAMLDEEHADCPRKANDMNSYVLGSIKNHNVVIACLPTDHYGSDNAAGVLSNMRRTFPNIEIGLMVGIGGGVPLVADMRLGDIVVGVRVMQYDMGKTFSDGSQRTAVPRIADSIIRTVISNLRSRHELLGSRVTSILRKKMGNHAAYSRPSEPDRLFLASYPHGDPALTCDECDSSKLETRKLRLSADPAIYYGGISSANTVIKDSTVRNKIARELDVLCFETESVGLMDTMPYLPIRGICDYSDSHKSKEWQRYAAATAAAYAYEFLEVWRGDSQDSYVGYTQAQNESLATPDRHKEILNSLDFGQIDARNLIIKAAHSKTCRWFLKHPDYLSWIDQQQTPQHHGFLWIRGKPGTGKSTIMKFISLESKKKDLKHRSLTASFFFNARGEMLEKTVSGMYRSLLLQLFHGFPDLESILDDPDLLPRHQSGCPPLNTLKDMLRVAVAKLGQRSFRCFIDALDECDEQQVLDLVEYFEDLASQCTEDNIDLGVCFSSRHYPYIDIKYGIRVILEEQTGHASDLENYIKSNLRVKDRPLLAELQEKILEKAAGVFLWVVLVVDIMNKENCRGRLAVRRRLEQVPSGLSDLFTDLLKRDNGNMEELQLSLFWILLSERPLKPDEYYHAIWSGLHLEGLGDLEIPKIDMEDFDDVFARCVISSSKGLAEITQDKQPTVQFIHESIRDFLIKDRGLHELWPDLGSDWESVGHDRLKMCCYSYFEFVVEKEQLEVEDYNGFEHMVAVCSEVYPFLQYASQFVLHHSDLAAHTADQQPFLESFRTFAWKGVVNAFEKFTIRKYSPGAGLLYLLADRGHSSLIQCILKNDANINTPSEKDRYVYPLIAAMAKGDKASVLALLRLPPALYEGMDITERLLPRTDASGSHRTPLSWACENGHFEIARVLVERDAEPIDTGRDAYSPLMLASKNGHYEIVRWLIARGADIGQSRRNESAILLAASNGHTKIVKLLLNYGADPDTRGVQDAPILCLAARKGYEEVVKLLVEKGADVETLNCWGETPLHLAAQNKGSGAVMQVLLSYGADINARDNEGRTPLISAIAGASIDEIGLLIRQGASAMARDNTGDTCLHAAMRRKESSLETVRLLLDNGARADARNNIGQTYLHVSARPLSTTFPEQDTYIKKFANHMASHTCAFSADSETQARISAVLPSLLKAFASQIGHENHTNLDRVAMAFVHRHRRKIAETFENIHFNQEHEDKTKVSTPSDSTTELGEDTVNRHDYTQGLVKGLGARTLIEDHGQMNSTTSEPQLDEQSPREEEATDTPLLIQDSAILRTTAFEWLLSRLLKQFQLTPMRPYVMQSINEKILSALPQDRIISRKSAPPTDSVSIEFDCHFFQFFKEQSYPRYPHEAFHDVITLTGSCEDAQAATCAQYLSQTWPSTAPYTLELIRDCLMVKPGCQRTMYYPDTTTLKVKIGICKFSAEVNGVAATIAEIGEQLAWLGATFRNQPEIDGIVYCTPHIDTVQNIRPPSQHTPEIAFRIEFALERAEDARDTNGQCWQSLFKNPLIVKGFPIPRRMEWNGGLEASLGIMTGLAQADQVHLSNERFYLKGYSTMLVPTRRSGDIQYWHLIHQTKGGRLSHFNNSSTQEQYVGSLNDLEQMRHVLGWCLKTEPFPGTVDSFAYSRLQSLEAQFFLLWDEKDKRGWLINGATALLHAVVESLAHAKNDLFRSELSAKGLISGKPCRSHESSAFEILNDERYQNLPLHSQNNGHITIKVKIEELCSMMEYFIDLQSHAAMTGRFCGRPRKDLEGWDFEDAVQNFKTFYPRTTTLEKGGKEWVDFIRGIKAVILFGEDFGEIIKPSRLGHETCKEWATLPKGQYYIATCVSDLQTVFKEHGKYVDGHLRLGDGLIWHSITPGSEACQCNRPDRHVNNNYRCEPVQICFPLGLAASLKSRRNKLPDNNDGALIFGHHSQFPWFWDDFDDPKEFTENEAPFSLKKIEKRIKKSPDSGIGSSLSTSQTETQARPRLRSEDSIDGPPVKRQRTSTTAVPAEATAIAQEEECMGIICALPEELAAVKATFDVPLESRMVIKDDTNYYDTGKIADHKVIVTCLPYKQIGTNAAASVAENMRRSFNPSLCLLVGIGGGAPSKEHDIRLGDVVVGSSVVQYDFGNETEETFMIKDRALQISPPKLGCLISSLCSDPVDIRDSISRYLAEIVGKGDGIQYRYPGHDRDILLQSCPTCRSCTRTCSHVREREQRKDSAVVVHYGKIASGNRVIKNAVFRDRVAADHNVLCFEMEAAGIANTMPYLVIRGISDYCDGNKNDEWHDYAAATAAAYSKLLLKHFKQ
ncbi:Uncharacterized protein LW93_12048 [Fusarium fujikuroi]|nr:Uncharacterized protein LW93_12048 [Fusarium fujikuroi]